MDSRNHSNHITGSTWWRFWSLNQIGNTHSKLELLRKKCGISEEKKMSSENCTVWVQGTLNSEHFLRTIKMFDNWFIREIFLLSFLFSCWHDYYFASFLWKLFKKKCRISEENENSKQNAIAMKQCIEMQRVHKPNIYIQSTKLTFNYDCNGNNHWESQCKTEEFIVHSCRNKRVICLNLFNSWFIVVPAACRSRKKDMNSKPEKENEWKREPNPGMWSMHMVPLILLRNERCRNKSVLFLVLFLVFFRFYFPFLPKHMLKKFDSIHLQKETNFLWIRILTTQTQSLNAIAMAIWQ